MEVSSLLYFKILLQISLFYFNSSEETVNISFFFCIFFFSFRPSLRERSDGFPYTLGKQNWGSGSGYVSRDRSRRKVGRAGDRSPC